MSIKLKLILTTIITSVIIFSLSISYLIYNFWLSLFENTKKSINIYSEEITNKVYNALFTDYKVVETFATFVESYSLHDYKTRTKFYNQFLLDLLVKNPHFLATWMSWELSAIDINWVKDYGRIRTIAFIQAGTPILIIDTVNLDGDIEGSDYYLMKKGIEKTLLSNPYFFSYTKEVGSSFLETSIGKAIFINNKFVGAVGIDLSLDELNNIVQQLPLFQKTDLVVFSYNQIIVAHKNKEYIGKNFKEAFPEFQKFNIISRSINNLPTVFMSEKNSQKNYCIFRPFKLPNSNQPWTVGVIVPVDFLNKEIIETIKSLLVVSGILLFLIVLILFITITIILNPLVKITNSLENLSKGIISEEMKLPVKNNDEIGRISKATNYLIDSLLRTQNFAIEIGKGNLSVEFEKLSEYDILGKTLIEMRDNLRKAKEEEINRLQQEKINTWLQTGIAQVNEILRENSNDLEKLSKDLIKYITTYTEANIGGFYLIEEEDIEYILKNSFLKRTIDFTDQTSEKIKIIRLKATYAYERFRELHAEYLIGEGLVGRVVQERKHFIVDNLPEGYLFVRSGLGDKAPTNLFIFPLMLEENVVGAIELASFKKLEDYKIQFLLELSTRIASSVSIIVKNLETANLAKELQLQNATFEMKEKQFRKQKQLLNEKQKELERVENQMQKIFDAIQNIGNYIEINPENFTILKTNDFLPTKFNAPKDEFIGKSYNDITIFKGTPAWTQKFWEDIQKGQIRKKQTIYTYNKSEIIVNETFFKYLDKESEKIIIIGM